MKLLEKRLFPLLNVNLKILMSSVLLIQVAFVGIEAQAKKATDTETGERAVRSQSIVHGTEASENLPWMAGLIYKTRNTEIPRSERNFCGGTLIHEYHILTAAHCVVSSEASDFQIFLGSHDLDDPNVELVDVAEIVVHPFYTSSPSGNDIALLRLSEPVDATPVSLYDETRDTILSELPATVFGWGITTDKPDETCELEFEDAGIDQDNYLCLVKNFGPLAGTQRTLLQAPESIVSDDECLRVYDEFYSRSMFGLSPLGDSENISQNLCTYDPMETSDPCYGDSGGPLVVLVDGELRQVGLSSRLSTSKCIEPNALNIYTKIPAYLEFINDVVGRDHTLGFDYYCPEQATIDVSYENLDNGMVNIFLNWSTAEGATSFVLRYLDMAAPNNLGRVEFGLNVTETSAILPPGFDLLVSIQARGTNCDGPASELLTVKG